MLRISRITATAYQRQSLVLPNGTVFTLTLYFMPMQQGWFIKELTYQDFVLQGVRISNNMNMLRQWKNLLPFGLACVSAQSREPSLLEDFATGASKLYIMTEADVQTYEDYLSDG